MDFYVIPCIDSRLLNFFNMGVIIISRFTDKRDIISDLVELMKKTEIPNIDKEKIYAIVMNLSSKTDKQKDRFIRFFGLKPNGLKRETLNEIAMSYKCTPSAIRSSVISVKITLYRIPEDKFEILNNIYQKYKR